ncbi:RDD family [Bordetella ansorpii]|uniref:RDD family n=1 Tax=Bordetella ansorpii TaxID=288768 RepID=A0A157SNN1_9BORD|nr:RDD family protein [Bordetella ansorpii]SAI72098.1 RDD family [Bordetella ansorpii]
MQQVTDTQVIDSQDTDQRYAPPTATVGDIPPQAPGAGRLAGRLARLAAVIIDSLLFLPAGIVVGVVDANGGSALAYVFAGIWFLAVAAVQIYMLVTRSQTVGKRAMKVRIVRADGSRIAFGRIFGLRYLVPALISAIPIVGSIFSLVDSLFIFRQDRRCIHDLIADSVVVQAD